MTDQEKGKFENLWDYSEELEFRLRIQQQKRGEEATKASIQRDLLAKQEIEELKKYAPLADEISNSPTFKERFCQLIANKNIHYIGDILEIGSDILLEFNFPVGLTSLVLIKLSKIAVNQYCGDLKKSA